MLSAVALVGSDRVFVGVNYACLCFLWLATGSPNSFCVRSAIGSIVITVKATTWKGARCERAEFRSVGWTKSLSVFVGVNYALLRFLRLLRSYFSYGSLALILL